MSEGPFPHVHVNEHINSIQLENHKDKITRIINPTHVESIFIWVPETTVEYNVQISTAKSTYNCYASEDEIKKLKRIKFL